MSDQVDFAVAIRIPEVDRENVKRGVDFTENVHTRLVTKTRLCACILCNKDTYLISISFCVAASRTINLTQGGGVIGLRSCGVTLY